MAQVGSHQQLSNHSELLSEFDPFHTPPEATSRQASPAPQLFPSSQPPQPSSTSSTPKPPPSLPSTAVSSDPLDSFDLLSFADHPPAQPTSSSAAHAARSHHILSSLSRTPFSSEPAELPDSAPSGAPVPVPPLRRRSSSSFSPPRRLSLLMQDSFAPSSPTPTVSHPSLNPFHAPPPEPHAAETYARRAASHEGDEEGDWGDFESGAVEKKELKRTKTVPVPTARRARGDEAGWKKEWSYDSKSVDAVQPIKLAGVMPRVNRILEEDMAEGIRPGLPPRFRLSATWTLLYSLDQHGISIQTMYERMKVGLRGSDSGVVLVVRDGEGGVFGAYVNQGLKESRSYYGDGTCFLWKATPFSPSDFRIGSSIKSYTWTGKNDYLVLSEAAYLSVGGGDGRFGLWIDGVFEKGFTSHCPCFDNDPLTGTFERGVSGVDESGFEVVGFECWAVAL